MGIARLVKAGWIGVNGVARQFYPSLTLSTLPLGSEVVYNSKTYTVIAQNGFVSGDVVLWTKNGTSSGSVIVRVDEVTAEVIATSTTPFGTANTNKVTVKRQKHSGNGKCVLETLTGYGIMLPATTLGVTSTTISVAESPAKFSYFSTDANNRRIRYDASGTARRYATSTIRVSGNNEDGWTESFYNVTNSGSTTSSISVNKTMIDIYAYSVKGSVNVIANSDGTYTLKI